MNTLLNVSMGKCEEGREKIGLKMLPHLKMYQSLTQLCHSCERFQRNNFGQTTDRHILKLEFRFVASSRQQHILSIYIHILYIPL